MVDTRVLIGGEMILPMDLRGCAGACGLRRIDWLFAGSSDGFGDVFGRHIQGACCVRRIRPSWLHGIGGMNPMGEASAIW